MTSPPPAFPFRIGYGYDVHQLVEGRPLYLGGVEIAHTLGLLGHSDADVLLHALCDALLGAAALGDIGYHFPNTDERFAGVRSTVLLQESVRLVQQAGWQPVNVDMTLVAEAPKINPHVPAMRATMAPLLGLPENCISIKATTNETLGYLGRQEGMCAHAVALLTALDTA